MKTKVERTAIFLFRLERKLNVSFASNFKSSVNHRTLLDTIRHANMWKMSALEIIKKRIEGKEAYFHDESELLEIDDEIYMVTSGEDYRQTLLFLDQVEDNASSIFKRIKGNEKSSAWSPKGFDETVLDYLMCTLVQRPIRRYLYYALRNNEQRMFVQLERFLLKNIRSNCINSNYLFDLSIFYDERNYEDIFSKRGEWVNNKMYNEIKNRTLSENKSTSMK